MKDFQNDSFLEGDATLQNDEPVGPLEKARENLELFADSFLMQDSLRQMIDWILTLECVLKDDSITELEKIQTKEELKIMEQAWSILADSLKERGITA